MATDVKARLTNTGISAQKVRLVIDMVRGKSVADALNILKFASRVCAEPIYKLIASAACRRSFDTQVAIFRCARPLQAGFAPLFPCYRCSSRT